ncbi:DMT family transporter [Mesonia ostreae]|uniref:DMT family transporter n=1 Tax=Mesonia ostreae TaxID=861110 RepID=A0ABU2KKN4_9FLAO|nr:DMT family transporter [Mesonia ostreae]MDT0295265.1 DMT family transporter [Mesonia ostreae]
MQQSHYKWLYLILLSLVWGSSFILIKKGLVGLTALQLGALRTALAAIFLLIIGFRSIKKIKKEQWKWIVVSGLLGSFFPAFLFAFAELEIDSAIVSILNSTVPILSIIIGFLIFSVRSTKNQVIGVFVGLLGSIFLIGSGATVNTHQNYWYALLPLVATTMYGFNVHIIKKYLQEVPALSITVGCFIILLFPSLAVLYFSGFFKTELLQQPEVQVSIGYIAILSVVGTGIAKILFNRLVQLSNPVFTTSVTYLIPVVALTWGVLDGEIFSFWQAVSGIVILIGVYFANKKRRVKA